MRWCLSGRYVLWYEDLWQRFLPSYPSSFYWGWARLHCREQHFRGLPTIAAHRRSGYGLGQRCRRYDYDGTAEGHALCLRALARALPIKSGLEDEPAAPKGNVVARNISWGGQWDEVGSEARPYITFLDNCVSEDPLFEEAPPKTFRLRDSSPAYRVGFKPIPFEKIGLYEDEYRRGLPSK